MQTLTFSSRIEAPVEDVFAWHTRPAAFRRLVPPWEDVTLVAFEGIRDGQKAVLKAGIGPIRKKWVAEHHGYIENRQFCDRQLKGPFSQWDHAHRFEPDGDDATILTDHIDYVVPFDNLGETIAGDQVRERLERQFAYRHRITQQDLSLHRRYNPEHQRLRIAISGASGLIGSNLVSFLRAGGHTVLRLVRAPSDAEDAVYWDYRMGEIEAEKLEGLDAVIHLAGEPIFGLRWTEEKKTQILGSRVRGTEFLSKRLVGLVNPPRTLIQASAIGYYGNRGSEKLTEASNAGSGGFLSAVTQEWEAASRVAVEAGIRTVQLRIGVVLTPEGGALEAMLPAFKLGLGGRVGAADQYLSWIALDDVLGATYHALLTPEVAGPVNLTSPHPATSDHFVQTLGDALSRPTALNVPSTVVRMVSGQAADEFLLSSIRALPERLLASGYAFFYPELAGALRHQLGRTDE